jgi:hypothetical protein
MTDPPADMPDWLSPLYDYATALGGEIDTLLADESARREAAYLATDRMRDGHILAAEAHLRALATGLGEEWTADYLWALWASYQGPLDDAGDVARVERDHAESQALWGAKQAAVHDKLRRYGYRGELFSRPHPPDIVGGQPPLIHR